MTLEFILFVTALLFGILLYWKESKGNKWYRLLNKIMYSKKLQMKETDKRGFVYQQIFLLRLVFITAFFLAVLILSQLLFPITLITISLFMTLIVGTITGTYIGSFYLKSNKVIEQQSDTITEIVQEVLVKGKEFMEDSQLKKEEKIENELEQELPKENQKSARERLKDKGLL